MFFLDKLTSVHIDLFMRTKKRVYFLKKIVQSFSPKTILIRVPLYERNWEIPMRKELGINYFSDSTHFIEHSKDTFKKEISNAELKIDSIEILWGEIWAKCIPQ